MAAEQDPPLVSVVIPAWNAAGFLRRAVVSALGQEKIPAVEILIVDDCSTDATVRVAEELAARHPSVTLLRNAVNGGPARSRNAGLAAARGDWIAVLDADDAFLPGRLARLIEVATRARLDVIADLPVLYDLAADTPAPTQLAASGGLVRLDLDHLLADDPETGLDLGLLKPVFRRDLVARGLLKYPEDIRHGEDHRLYTDLLRKGVPFGLLREAHYVFSTRFGAVSGRYSPGSVTSVDYRGQAQRTAAFAAELAATGEMTPQRATLLEARAAKALRQNRIYGWTLLRRGEWRRLGQWLRQHPGNAASLLAAALRKLAGHRGLPD